MSPLSPSIGKATIADRLFGRGPGTDLVLIMSGVALTAIAAQVTIPLWLVPLTGQSVVVLLVGSTLGALRGTLSMALYLVAGALGLPIFSNGWSGLEAIHGQTGGYLIGFIGAAAFTGWMAQRGWDRKIPGAFLSALGGTAVIYAVGLPWLAAVSTLTFAETLDYGLYPLVLGDAVKMVVVALIVAISWTAILRVEQREETALHPTEF